MKFKPLILVAFLLCTKLAYSNTEKSLVGFVGRGDPVGCVETMGVMLPKVADKEYSASELVCGVDKYLTVQEKLGMDGNKVSTKIVHVLPILYGSKDILLVPQ